MKNKDNRALNAIRKMNKIRHDQAKQIDILCNDMVSAHGDFIEQLSDLAFTVNFYESICGKKDLPKLINTVADQIKDVVRNSNISIFLIDGESFNLHITNDDPIEVDSDQFESFFTLEVVNSISRSHKVCTIGEMTRMGLQGNPLVFSRLSAAAVPLGGFGNTLGFILVSREIDNKLTASEIAKITTIKSGLSKAISSCRETININQLD